MTEDQATMILNLLTLIAASTVVGTGVLIVALFAGWGSRS